MAENGKTLGIIEVGGGSSQIAFLPSGEDVNNSLDLYYDLTFKD